MHMWKFHISMSVTKEVEFKERFVLLLITYYNKYICHAVSSFLTIITYIFFIHIFLQTKAKIKFSTFSTCSISYRLVWSDAVYLQKYFSRVRF